MLEVNEKKLRYIYFQLPEEKEFASYQMEHGRSLGELGFINLFIGQNNSGKSRLLRMLFADRTVPYRTMPAVSEEYNRQIDDLTKYITSQYTDLISGYGFPNPATLLNRVNIGFTEPSKHPSLVIDSYVEHVSKKLGTVRIKDNNKNIIEKVEKALKNAYIDIQQYVKDNLPEIAHDEKRIYIPILRGLRSLPPLLVDNHTEKVTIPASSFQRATTRDYFSKNRNPDSTFLSGKYSIFSGLELYGLLKNMLLGLPEQRDQVRAFEHFLSKNFFQNEAVTLIPFERDDVVHVKIGTDAQRPIYDLGDGLQSLIICTFNAFMEKERCTFFIEEPDTYMHPGMQRAFINALKERPQHQYFITTHSNHMLDMTLDYSDISVFRLRRQEEKNRISFHIKNCVSGDRSLLQELGVKNSSVFLTNATIWVEGITDRLYLRVYMDKYLDELSKSEDQNDKAKYELYSMFHEDTHFSFVEYQGSCLAHWIFDEESDIDGVKVSKLCADAMVIVDGDVNEKPRAINLKMELGERFVTLKCKEIENLIPKSILQKVVPEVYRVNGAGMDSLSYEYYSTSVEGMGTILAKVISGGEKILAPSGTVKKKSELCKAAVSEMGSNEEWVLTEPIIDLLEKINRHIESNNH